MANAHVLIADDDAALIGTMTWVLKEHGYEVTATHKGHRVVPLMAERTPDLVLLDIQFADVDGTEVLEHIKSDDRWRDIPVLMMSSVPLEEAAVRTLGLGAADYVRKPFRVRELLARIQAQLRMRAILRSAHASLREPWEALSPRGGGRPGPPPGCILHDGRWSCRRTRSTTRWRVGGAGAG